MGYPSPPPLASVFFCKFLDPEKRDERSVILIDGHLNYGIVFLSFQSDPYLVCLPSYLVVLGGDRLSLIAGNHGYGDHDVAGFLNFH